MLFMFFARKRQIGLLQAAWNEIRPELMSLDAALAAIDARKRWFTLSGR